MGDRGEERDRRVNRVMMKRMMALSRDNLAPRLSLLSARWSRWCWSDQIQPSVRGSPSLKMTRDCVEVVQKFLLHHDEGLDEKNGC